MESKRSKQIWRKYVNQQLKSKYKLIFPIKLLSLFKAKNFSLLQK